MGSSATKTTPVKTERRHFDPDALPYSKIVRIREIWRQINSENACFNAFVAILNENENVRAMFGFNGISMIGTAEDSLREHAKLIHAFLEKIVQKLENNRETTKFLVNLGSYHFNREIKFSSDNWLAFKRCFTTHLLAEIYELDQVAAGQLSLNDVQDKVTVYEFFNYVIKNMKHGFVSAAAGKT